MDNINSNSFNNDIISSEERRAQNEAKAKKRSKRLMAGFLTWSITATATAIAAPLILNAVRKGGTGDTASHNITATTDSGINSIKFEVNGKIVTNAKAGETVKVLIDEKEDYVLSSLTSNGIEIREAKQFVMPKTDCNVDAKTTCEVAYINLELNGGTTTGSTKIKLPKGEYFGYADLPTDITKANATKGEWYFDKEMTKMVTPDTVITESATLYLNWFEKFADKPDCVGIRANQESELFAFYDAILENNSNSTNSVQASTSNGDVGIISLEKLQYSFDGANWYKLTNSKINLPVGKNIYVYSEMNDTSMGAGENVTTRFIIHGDVSIGGSILGLLFGGNAGENKYIPEKGAFSLFKDSDGITAVADDFIPVETVMDRGCERMFQNCINLQIAPELPARKVTSYGYYEMFSGCTRLYVGPTSIGVKDESELEEWKPLIGYASCTQMFYGCTSLLVAPDLPDLYVAEFAYQRMFENCSSLPTSGLPKIGAMAMRTSCCDRMFLNCTSITEIPEHYFDSVKYVPEYCYNEMFENCTSLVRCNATLPAVDCLYYDEDEEEWYTWSGLETCCYDRMFNYCTSLNYVPEDMLPCDDIYYECYAGMFQYCKSLKKGPKLPAVTLYPECYTCMFLGSGLVVAPELPAGKANPESSTGYDGALAQECYKGMFAYCHNLLAAPDLPATQLVASCYETMFYECSSLETASVGGNDVNDRIQTGSDTTYCCHQMFRRCRSLKTVRFNYQYSLFEDFFQYIFCDVGSEMILYCDTTSTYYNSDYIDRTVTIKPFSDTMTFVQVLPADYDPTSHKIIESNLKPYTSVDCINYMYESKYGVTGSPDGLPVRYTSDSTTKIGDIVANCGYYLGAKAKPGCYTYAYQYYDKDLDKWVDTDATDTKTLGSFNSDVTLRVVFAPTKIITCPWSELIEQINLLYEATTQDEWVEASNAFLQYFTEAGKFEPEYLREFTGVTREVTVNGQKHNVVIANTVGQYVGSSDIAKQLVDVAENQYMTKAVFTFQFQNLISDENGYSLTTTFNGSGPNSTADVKYYPNSDLRKAMDGGGTGTIRWFRKGETEKTTAAAYKDKSVLDMITASEPTLAAAFKNIKQMVFINKGSYWEYTSNEMQTKLFCPNTDDMRESYLYDDWWSYPSATYILRQTNGATGCVNKPTYAKDDDGNENAIANYAGFIYNDDIWYGQSYWTSYPFQDDAANKGRYITYDGNISGSSDWCYCLASTFAHGVAPMFCL